MMFSIYKRGQGKYTRLVSAITLAAIVALGCLQLYRKLHANELGLWVETMVPVGIAVAFGILLFWLSNKHSLADFLIASEGELKKVNWSSRREIAVSTIVVIVVVVFMAIFLGVVDLLFELFFSLFLQ